MRVRDIFFIILFITILLLIPFITKDKKVEFSEIKEVIEPYLHEEIVKEVGSTIIYNNYKINPNSLDGYISYGPISYMTVEEITIFKEQDKEQQALIVNKIKDYIAKKITTFEGYAPLEVELLKKAIVEVKGDYIFCIILKDNTSLWHSITNLF